MILDKNITNNKYKNRSYRPGPEIRYAQNSDQHNTKITQSLRSELEEKYDDARKARMPFELIWLRNHHFVLGNQFIDWNSLTQTLFVPNAPAWRVRLVVNHIRPAVNYHIAQLTKNQPIISVMPRTSEENDVNKAKLSERFLDWFWDEADMHQKLQALAMRMIVYGSGFLHVYWNPQTGPSMDVPKGMGLESIRLGDINVDVFSPYEWYPNPVDIDHNGLRWAFRGRVVHVDEIRDRFPEMASEIQEEHVPFNSMFHTRLKYFYGDKSTYDSRAVAKNSLFFREFYERPTQKHSKGRYIAFTEKYILAQLTLEDVCGPDNYDVLPQVKFDDFQVADRYWGDSSVNHWIGPQQEINRTRSQMLEIRNLNLKPKVLIEKGSGLANNSWTSEPGELVAVNNLGQIRILEAPQLPSGYYQLVQILNEDWKEITGKYEVNTGEGSGGTRAASGIALLQEQTQINLAPRSTLFERQILKLAKQILRLAKNFYIEPRIIRIIGENNMAEVLSFTGEDFNTADVRVQPTSALPRLKAARQAYVFQLLQMGLLQGLDSKKILDLLELGDIAVSNDVNELNTSRARYENMMMEKGQPIMPQPQENHQMHLQEHQRFMNTSSFYNLPPPVQQIYQMHLFYTNQMVMQQMMQQQAQMGMNPNGQTGQPAQGQQQQQNPQQKSQGPFSSGEMGAEGLTEIRQGI